MALAGQIIKYIIDKQSDDFFTKKIAEFKGTCFASNSDHEIYGELGIVNDFKYLTFTIMGPLKVHVYQGCKLFFETGNQPVEIESDSLEIQTDYSKKLQLGMTAFDIDLTEELENTLRNDNISSIKIVINKTALLFECDKANMIEILNSVIEHDETEMGNENMDPFGL